MGEHGNSIWCRDSIALQVVQCFKENPKPHIESGDNSQSQHSPKPTEQMKLYEKSNNNDDNEMWDVYTYYFVQYGVWNDGRQWYGLYSSSASSHFSYQYILSFAMLSIKSMENLIVRIMCHITFHCLSLYLLELSKMVGWWWSLFSWKTKQWHDFFDVTSNSHYSPFSDVYNFN